MATMMERMDTLERQAAERDREVQGLMHWRRQLESWDAQVRARDPEEGGDRMAAVEAVVMELEAWRERMHNVSMSSDPRARLGQLETRVNRLAEQVENLLRVKELSDGYKARDGLSGQQQPRGVAGGPPARARDAAAAPAGGAAGGEGEAGREPPEGFLPAGGWMAGEGRQDAGAAGQGPPRAPGAERGPAADCQGADGRAAGDQRGQGAEADQAGAQPAAVRGGDGELAAAPGGEIGSDYRRARQLKEAEDLAKYNAEVREAARLLDATNPPQGISDKIDAVDARLSRRLGKLEELGLETLMSGRDEALALAHAIERRLDDLEELLRLIAVEGHDKKLWDYQLLVLRAGMGGGSEEAPQLVLDPPHAYRALQALGNPQPSVEHVEALLALMVEHRAHGGGRTYLAAVDQLGERQGSRIVRERLGIIDRIPTIDGLPAGNARIDALKLIAETGCTADEAARGARLSRAQMGHGLPGGVTLDRFRMATAKDGEAVPVDKLPGRG